MDFASTVPLWIEQLVLLPRRYSPAFAGILSSPEFCDFDERTTEKRR
jgi:hypothetical protein